MKFKTIKNGQLTYKVPLKKSPKGRIYAGKTVFATIENAKQHLGKFVGKNKSSVWREGRTIYFK